MFALTEPRLPLSVLRHSFLLCFLQPETLPVLLVQSHGIAGSMPEHACLVPMHRPPWPPEPFCHPHCPGSHPTDPHSAPPRLREGLPLQALLSPCSMSVVTCLALSCAVITLYSEPDLTFPKKKCNYSIPKGGNNLLMIFEEVKKKLFEVCFH